MVHGWTSISLTVVVVGFVIVVVASYMRALRQSLGLDRSPNLIVTQITTLTVLSLWCGLAVFVELLAGWYLEAAAVFGAAVLSAASVTLGYRLAWWRHGKPGAGPLSDSLGSKSA